MLKYNMPKLMTPKGVKHFPYSNAGKQAYRRAKTAVAQGKAKIEAGMQRGKAVVAAGQAKVAAAKQNIQSTMSLAKTNVANAKAALRRK